MQKVWTSSVAALYGIHAIPMNFLLDRTGRIVARNLRGDAFERQLAVMLRWAFTRMTGTDSSWRSSSVGALLVGPPCMPGCAIDTERTIGSPYRWVGIEGSPYLFALLGIDYEPLNFSRSNFMHFVY